MLCYDIESKVLNNNIDPTTDEFKTIAMYDVKADKHYFFTDNDIDEIKKVFSKHKVIIGHNNIDYDNVILKRYGISLKYHTILDTLVIARKRAQFLGITYESKSLSNLAKFFKLEHYKDDDFDYDILQKEEWTTEELKYIEDYNKNDVIVTYELFKHFKEFFEPFKEYLSDYNNSRYNWLMSSIASYAYKAVCHTCGLIEEYDDTSESMKYEGGYVTEPITKYADNVVLFDFASLYPHVFAQCNLFSPEKDGWNNEKLGVQGEYSTRAQGLIEKQIIKWYKQRAIYKTAGDKREYVIKIIINSLYGASANPVFKNIYNRTGARDCTAISRYCVKTAINCFEQAGFRTLYTDTDSVYIQLRGKQSLLEAQNVADIIVKTLQEEFTFPENTFKLKIDDEIKHIYFFKKNDKFLKKMYIYVNNKDELVIKGLPMIKNDGSRIGYYMFKKYMEKDIKQGIKDFKYYDIKQKTYEELKNNPLMTARSFRVKETSFYKNKSQLQAQISNKYGSGTHILITNNKYGVGKGKKYCTVEEFEEQNLNVYDIDLSKYWSEIRLFIDDMPERMISNTPASIRSQKTLSDWGNL